MGIYGTLINAVTLCILIIFSSRDLMIPGLEVGTLDKLSLYLSRASKCLRNASSTLKCTRNESGAIVYYQKGYVFSRILWSKSTIYDSLFLKIISTILLVSIVGTIKFY